MTSAAPYDSADSRFLDGYLPRKPWIWAPFLVPVVLCGASWAGGGVPALTDLGFLILTCLSAVFLAAEFLVFGRRFGIGGMVLFGGVLTWFCYDYMMVWFGIDFHRAGMPFDARVVAKAAFCHTLFITFMVVGLLLPVGRAVKALQWVPEPPSRNIYFFVAVVCFLIGLSPFVLFTAEPWYEAMYKSMVGGRAMGAQWTVGRSGNINYSWGAYVAQILQIGQVGAMLGVFYAILFRGPLVLKLICWGMWLVQLALSFGTGSRGDVAFIALPILAAVFLRHHAEAAAFFRRLSLRAYVYGGLIAFAILVMVQIQATFRTVSFQGVDFTQVDVLKLRGNTMFSEGLLGYAEIPETRTFFYASRPGEGVLRPMPQTIFEFIIGPIPRALWKNKPIDAAWSWYNEAYTGDAMQGESMRGTTISQGMVGYWYFRYGLPGVIQGAILLGWLMRLSERALQDARGQLMRILLALGVAAWLFRGFRGIGFANLYPLLIGAVAIAAIVWVMRIFVPRQPAPSVAMS